MGASTLHGWNLDGICIQHTSCYLDVLEGRLIVYLGEDRFGKAVDDVLNPNCVAWRHACCVVYL
jgi:hypothetical protein